MLKEDEARELIQGLISLLDNPNHHIHVNDDSFEHEITVAIYDEKNIEEFHDRIKKVINEDT